jgi:hypothetical protein
VAAPTPVLDAFYSVPPFPITAPSPSPESHHTTLHHSPSIISLPSFHPACLPHLTLLLFSELFGSFPSHVNALPWCISHLTSKVASSINPGGAEEARQQDIVEKARQSNEVPGALIMEKARQSGVQAQTELRRDANPGGGHTALGFDW